MYLCRLFTFLAFSYVVANHMHRFAGRRSSLHKADGISLLSEPPVLAGERWDVYRAVSTNAPGGSVPRWHDSSWFPRSPIASRDMRRKQLGFGLESHVPASPPTYETLWIDELDGRSKGYHTYTYHRKPNRPQ